jgi:subtilisin-like proprotein convertase family protein
MIKARNNYFFTLNPAPITVGQYSQTCNYEFNSQPHLAIPDNNPTGISDTIRINENQYISDVNVKVNISHTYIRDLRVVLEAPDGTQVMLWNHHCGSQDNLQVVFDDQGQNIDCNNLTGHIKPTSSLSVLTGKYTRGAWILKVSDNAHGDTGTLNDWGLQFCYMTGIDHQLLPNVKIYPNPSNGNIHIHFPLRQQADVKIMVSDMTGRIIYQKKWAGEGKTFDRTIHLPVHAIGNYFLIILHGNYQHRSILQLK